METVRMTTAQALVKFLNQQYVEFDGKRHQFIKGIFTIFGHGNVVGLGQALEEDPGNLDVYQGRNEQGMANAAMAFSKQKHRKQIMACTSSVGPGSANMVTTWRLLLQLIIFRFLCFLVMYLQLDSRIPFCGKLNSHMIYLFLQTMLSDR